MKKLICLISLFLLLVSCSSTKLSDAGEKVKVLQKLTKNCDAVAKVVGISYKGLASLAKNHARNLAAKAGANALMFNDEVSNGKKIQMHATAYLCK